MTPADTDINCRKNTDAARYAGLTTDEAGVLLAKHGKNSLEFATVLPLPKLFWRELKDPMSLVLTASAILAAVAAAISGHGLAEVLSIAVIVLINATLGVLQELRAEKMISELMAMTHTKAQTLRDGVWVRLSSEELVPGDIIRLSAGRAVPADALILECSNLRTDESILSGKAVSLIKAPAAPGAETDPDSPGVVRLGTTVVSGCGLARVIATGRETEAGKIAGVLENTVTGDTPLQRRLNRLSLLLTCVVASIWAVTFIAGLLSRHPKPAGIDISSTFVLAVSLAVAAIPEALSAVVSITLSISARRMSSRSAVVRRLTSVEALGCTQVICFGKTGTLTENRSHVAECHGADLHWLAKVMVLVCDSSAVEFDPSHRAFLEYAGRIGADTRHAEASYPRTGEYELDRERQVMTTFHSAPGGGYLMLTKGPPGELLPACTHFLGADGPEPMTERKKEEILAFHDSPQRRAMHIMGAAQRFSHKPMQDEPEPEHDMCWLGLAALADPVREEAATAIDDCRAAGIRPVMMTGDYREPAVAVAIGLGIISDESEAITGAELDRLSDSGLLEHIETCSLYAQVNSAHKARIISAWRDKGFVTAMAGVGISDAPSLKSADIGVGLGVAGTDLAIGAAADMVLTDDSFSAMVAAIGEGRRVYENLRRIMQFLLASNLAELLLVIFVTLAGFSIFSTVQLLWVNFISDFIPALGLGMEEAERGAHTAPPPLSRASVFSGGLGRDIIIEGLFVFCTTLAAFVIGDYLDRGIWSLAGGASATTTAFLALAMTEALHSFNMRSHTCSVFRMPYLNIHLAGAAYFSVVSTMSVVFMPALAKLFGLVRPSPLQFCLALALALLIIPYMELIKAIKRRRHRR